MESNVGGSCHDDHKPKLILIGSPFQNFGRERFLKKLTKILDKICSKILVVGANEPYASANISWEAFEIRDNTTGLTRYLRFIHNQAVSIKKMLKNNHDYVFILNTFSFLPALLVRATNKRSGTFATQKTNSKIHDFLSTLTLTVSEKVIVESPSVIEEWGETFRGKVVTGATYVDTDEFVRKSLASERPNTIGFLGNLDTRKGIPELLSCIESFSRSDSQLKFKIGGHGPLEEQVEVRASELSNLEFVDFVADSDLCDFYNSVRGIVLPTRSEGLPNVALEAMACGTPLISTRAGGLPDIIQHGVNGFLLEGLEPNQIRGGIKEVQANSSLDEIGKNAATTIRNQFEFNDAKKRYRQIIMGNT